MHPQPLCTSGLPTVSYIIASYNEERYIEGCLLSIIAQEYPSIEIVLVDDGSTDNTVSIARRVLASQSKCSFKILALTNNFGKCNAYNEAYRNSTGSVVTLIGADDIAPTFRTLIAVNAMIKSDSLYVYGSYRKFYIQNGIQISMLQKLIPINPWFYNAVPGGTSFLSRSLADLIYPIPISLPAEDWYMSYHAYLNGVTPYYVDDLFLYYRISDSNSTSVESRPSYLKAIKREIITLSHFASETRSNSSSLLNYSIHLRGLIIAFLEDPSLLTFLSGITCIFSPLRTRFLKALFLVLSRRS